MAVARKEVVEMALQRLGIGDADAAGELSAAYGLEIEKKTMPFPGAIDTLKHLRSENVLLALVSNGASDVQRKKIDRFRLQPLFNSIVIEGELGVGKPDRRIFQHALSQLGVESKDAWMVGDDLARDVEGAQQLGIHSIWVDWAYKGLPPSARIKPDRIITSISEIV